MATVLHGGPKQETVAMLVDQNNPQGIKDVRAKFF